jgi:hypothetical protein
MALSNTMTTTRPIRKMMPTVLPRNLSMRLSSELPSLKSACSERFQPSGESDEMGRWNGSREWDRTTDHLHVKEVLYH